MQECFGPVKLSDLRIRIVLVEDHDLVREGLKALLELEPDFDLVGEFASVEVSLKSIGRLRPDVLITDLSLPGLSGMDLLRDIQQLSPATRKLVLSAHQDEENIRAALAAGADGYVFKGASYAELMVAIRVVAAGQSFICKAGAGEIFAENLSGFYKPSVSPVSQILTEREREVLTQIALGYSNKSIARQLGLSPKTIEKHRCNMMRKLRLRNSADITMFAAQNGLAGN